MRTQVCKCGNLYNDAMIEIMTMIMIEHNTQNLNRHKNLRDSCGEATGQDRLVNGWGSRDLPFLELQARGPSIALPQRYCPGSDCKVIGAH